MKNWPVRDRMQPGSKTVLRSPLFEHESNHALASYEARVREEFREGTRLRLRCFSLPVQQVPEFVMRK